MKSAIRRLGLPFCALAPRAIPGTATTAAARGDATTAVSGSERSRRARAVSGQAMERRTWKAEAEKCEISMGTGVVRCAEIQSGKP